MDVGEFWGDLDEDSAHVVMGYACCDWDAAHYCLYYFLITLCEYLGDLAADVQEVYYFSLHFGLVDMPEHIQGEIEYLHAIASIDKNLTVIEDQTLLNLIEAPNNINISHGNRFHKPQKKPINKAQPAPNPLIQSPNNPRYKIRQRKAHQLQHRTHLDNIGRGEDNYQYLVKDL